MPKQRPEADCGCFSCALGRLIDEHFAGLQETRLQIETMAGHLAMMISTLPDEMHPRALDFVEGLIRRDVQEYEKQDEAVGDVANELPI